ncbi:MAG: alpha/beta hydrolase, partial [Caldilineaceae bacterium]|nr:alpha/beta hydrolase [Caldilineaceae bacterium]
MPNTIINSTAKLTGEWVGYLLDNAQSEFVRLSFDGPWCDLPQRNEYNVPIAVGDDETTVLIADLLQLQLEDDPSSQKLRGQTNGAGRIQLWPLLPIAENPNPMIGGSYQLENGRDLFIAAEAAISWPAWQLYYREGDHHVRLYPLDAGMYLSERVELFTFAGETLTIQTMDGKQSTGERAVSYDQEVVTIAVAAGYQIAGSLFTPLQPAPHLTIILVHGAGPGLRDNYLMVADRFARQGIAVFVYDKQGWGDSTGEQLWSDITKLAGDVVEIIRQIRR